ncbi:site-determining protein [Synergistales bacterium]|nr:site-determining protein [Synergistales bacterium]
MSIVSVIPASDQASRLREMMKDKEIAPNRIRGMRSIAVLSGKGGVGKSNIAVNVGLAIAERDLRVAILDADLGLANIDILFGVVPKYNLSHILRGEKELSDIVFKVGENVSIIPGGSGLRELADLDGQSLDWVINKLSFLENETDVLIMDTSAGLHRNVLAFAAASDISLLITTPEPTAIKDAYSVIKSLWQIQGGDVNVKLVVNMASDRNEAALVADKIISTSEQFLGFKIPYLGYVAWDGAISASVKKRKPLLLENKNANPARYFRELADKILELDDEGAEINEKDSFLRRLVKQMMKASV